VATIPSESPSFLIIFYPNFSYNSRIFSVAAMVAHDTKG